MSKLSPAQRPIHQRYLLGQMCRISIAKQLNRQPHHHRIYHHRHLYTPQRLDHSNRSSCHLGASWTIGIPRASIGHLRLETYHLRLNPWQIHSQRRLVGWLLRVLSVTLSRHMTSVSPSSHPRVGSLNIWQGSSIANSMRNLSNCPQRQANSKFQKYLPQGRQL